MYISLMILGNMIGFNFDQKISYFLEKKNKLNYIKIKY